MAHRIAQKLVQHSDSTVVLHLHSRFLIAAATCCPGCVMLFFLRLAGWCLLVICCSAQVCWRFRLAWDATCSARRGPSASGVKLVQLLLLPGPVLLLDVVCI